MIERRPSAVLARLGRVAPSRQHDLRITRPRTSMIDCRRSPKVSSITMCPSSSRMTWLPPLRQRQSHRRSQSSSKAASIQSRSVSSRLSTTPAQTSRAYPCSSPDSAQSGLRPGPRVRRAMRSSARRGDRPDHRDHRRYVGQNRSSSVLKPDDQRGAIRSELPRFCAYNFATIFLLFQKMD